MSYTEPEAAHDGGLAGADGAMRGRGGEYGLSLIRQAHSVYRKGGAYVLQAWVRGYLEGYRLTQHTLEEQHDATQPDGS